MFSRLIPGDITESVPWIGSTDCCPRGYGPGHCIHARPGTVRLHKDLDSDRFPVATPFILQSADHGVHKKDALRRAHDDDRRQCAVWRHFRRQIDQITLPSRGQSAGIWVIWCFGV